METFWMVTGAACIFVAAGLTGWIVVRQPMKRRQQSHLAHARTLFRRRREWLEAQFLTIASERSKPRDMIWADCDFDDLVAFARDRETGRLRALVGVAISFEPDGDDGVDDIEALCAVRAATAVFTFENGQWTTDGRAVFNLNPQETIRCYEHELEVLD